MQAVLYQSYSRELHPAGLVRQLSSYLTQLLCHRLSVTVHRDLPPDVSRLSLEIDDSGGEVRRLSSTTARISLHEGLSS